VKRRFSERGRFFYVISFVLAGLFISFVSQTERHVLDLSFKNSNKPTVGSVLISDPFLDEDYFRRSVVLICDHNDEGTFGFVLNNYLDIDLHEVDSDFPDIQARISVGGPVETQSLFFIHSFGKEIEGAVAINDSLFFGGDYEQVQLLLKDPSNKNRIRFFLGYSGWSKDQLKGELKENSWIVASNITANEILNTSNEKFWEYCLEKQGERFKTISKFPINPQNN
jgi:putative transcriptional regulator